MSQPVDNLSSFYQERLRYLLQMQVQLERGEIAPPPGFTPREAQSLTERAVLSTYRMLVSLGLEGEALRLIQAMRRQ